MARFQNLTVDHKDVLGKLSVSDRIRLLYTESGRNMLASLTAEQYAKLFPTYYREKLPEISGFMKALTPEGQRALVNAQQIGEGTYSSPDGKTPPRTELGIPSGRAKPPVLQRLEKILETSGVSDVSAKPQLNTEQKELIKKMRQGQVVSADNETAAFIAKLSPEQRQQAGILEATDEAGKPAFKMAPTQVTRQEIESARRSTINGGDNREIIMKSFADEMRKQGVPESNIPYAVAAMAGQVKAESGFNPRAVHDSGTGYGIYGARDPSPGRGRRTDMFKWLEANGYQKDSPEGQARYMVHEAFTKYPQTRRALVGANKDNIGEVTGVLVNDFERPKERANNIRVRTQHSIGFFESATRIAENRDLSGNMTDEQIEQIVKERKERGQEQALASNQEKPKLPNGVDPRFAQLYEQMPLGQAQNAVRAIERRGLENFNNDVKKAFEEGAEGTSTRRPAPGRGVGIVEAPGAPGTTLRPDAVGNLISMSNQRAVRNKPLSGNLTDQLNYAASMSGVKVEVFSGGQAGIGSGGPRVGSTRHDHGGAADIKLAVTDAQGRRRYLDMRNPDDAAKMETFVRHAVHAGATGVGAGMGYMGASSIHVGGGRSASWGGADWIARAHAAGTQSRKDQPVDLAAWNERRQSELAAAQEQSSNVQMASDEAIKQERESSFRNAFNPERLRQAGVLGRGGIIEAPGAPGTLTNQGEQTETPSVPQYYNGGEQKVEGEAITAFPISGLNGDNAIVADSNSDPLFTMNTNKESASYDPKSRKVEVQPVKRNEPEQLKGVEDNTQSMTQNEMPTPQENTNSSEMRPAPALDPNYSLQAAITASANPFTTPSFERAVNAANFKRTGYNYDHGSANLR